MHEAGAWGARPTYTSGGFTHAGAGALVGGGSLPTNRVLLTAWLQQGSKSVLGGDGEGRRSGVVLVCDTQGQEAGRVCARRRLGAEAPGGNQRKQAKRARQARQGARRRYEAASGGRGAGGDASCRSHAGGTCRLRTVSRPPPPLWPAAPCASLPPPTPPPIPALAPQTQVQGLPDSPDWPKDDELKPLLVCRPGRPVSVRDIESDAVTLLSTGGADGPAAGRPAGEREGGGGGGGGPLEGGWGGHAAFPGGAGGGQE